ncbi:metalloregulator ArsR/SmtB family transcription factor [Actinomadura oligospora]|uniref:metalloregulator ArsR/SmtB family transcription factor n=1 Tax=Actinomadura oligospora TaxID=111804 RepID=UPI0004B95B64|nr:metalloregulator ArsR/SmtB family transcription factor [Actinomadura oligospora]
MVNDPFRAVAHPIRRAMIERLGDGPASVGEVTSDLGVSKPAITKHLKILEDAGVVERRVVGRTHRLALNPAALIDAITWVDRQRALWERMFDTVEEYLADKEQTTVTDTVAPSVVRIERTYRASADVVFDAWTNPEVIRKWWHPGPDWETSEAQVDLRVGGRLRVVMLDTDGVEHAGSATYTAVERPSHLAWTWHGEEDQAGTGSRCDLVITEHDGVTHAVLTHSGLPDEHAAASLRQGWILCLDNLDKVIAR